MANCMVCGGSECVCRSVRERRDLDGQVERVLALFLDAYWPPECVDIVPLLASAVGLVYDYHRHEVRRPWPGCGCQFKPGNGSGTLSYKCGDGGGLCEACHTEQASQEVQPDG